MTVIRSLLGDVDPASAGLVDAHDHLVAHATPALVSADQDLRLDDPARVRADLAAFRDAGGGTLVEMTTVDYGRDLPALRELARDTGVHLVAATGFNVGTYARPFCAGRDARELSATQVRDIEDERCGIVKFGTGLDVIAPWEQVALEAAAHTHHLTGCPILTHTQHGTMAEEQLARLRVLGVAAEAVTLGHLDHNRDLAVHLRLADAGAHLSYDQLPKPKHATAEWALECLAALAHRGLHTQVVVGGDLARRSGFAGWGGGPGPVHLLTTFRDRLLDALTARGLPAVAIAQAVLHDNPVDALAVRD